MRRASSLIKSGISATAEDKPLVDPMSFLILHDYPPPEVERPWREFLSRIDSPAHYDSPDYFLEPHWTGKRPFAVLVIDQARVIAVSTGIHLQEGVSCGLAPRPQTRIDDKADALRAADSLVEGLLQEAGRETLISVFSWSWLPLPSFECRGFLRRELEGNVVLDLRMGADALFKQFHENRKRNVRVAQKNGIEVSEATTPEDLTAYWSVYSAWRRTERKKIMHDQSFEAAEKRQSMRQNHRRFLARYKGEVVAATGLRFYPGGLVEYANNCSLDQFMHLRPNDLLVWKTIQWACEQKFTTYSMGGAHPFLRKSGGTIVPIHRYRLDRSFLHRYDLKDNLRAKTRSLVLKAPGGMVSVIRKLLGKS